MVEQKVKSVQNRSSASLSWYPVVEGDAIVENDTVMTGANSTALVRLKDGGEVQLEPYTLIKFNRLSVDSGNRLALEVNRGAIKVRAATTGVLFRIRQKEVALVPQSEVVLTSAGTLSPEIEVTRGSVSVESLEVPQVAASAEAPKREILSLSAGQAVSLTPNAPAVISRLVVENPSPGAGSQVFYQGERARVALRWDGEGGERVEWDQNPDFKTSRLIPLHGRRDALMDLEPGKYYWRVVGRNALSGKMDFTVMPVARYTLASTAYTKSKEGMVLPLSWGRVPGAESYVLELSQDRQFRTIDRSYTPTGSSVTLESLPPGKHFWRVRATHAYLGDWPLSQVYEIDVRPQMAPPRPKGVKVLESKKDRPKRGSFYKWKPAFDLVASLWITRAQAATSDETGAEMIWLEFSWENMRGAKAYRLEVSTAKSFRKPLHTELSSKNTVVVELPDRQEYFWRVAGIDEDGDLGKFSSTQVIKREIARREKPVRQLASVPEPPPHREPTALPPAPEPPVITFPVAQVPRFRRMWLGYGSAFVRQGIAGTGFAVRGSGLPINRVVVGANQDFAASVLEFNGWLQPLQYKSAELQPSFGASQVGAEVLWRRASSSLPLHFGARVRNEIAVLDFASETVSLESVLFASVMVGTGWKSKQSWAGEGSLWLEVGPVGKRRGVGLLWRNRWNLPWKTPVIAPAVELLVHPQYRNTTNTSRTSEFTIEAAAALILQWTAVVDDVGLKR